MSIFVGRLKNKSWTGREREREWVIFDWILLLWWLEKQGSIPNSFVFLLSSVLRFALSLFFFPNVMLETVLDSDDLIHCLDLGVLYSKSELVSLTIRTSFHGSRISRSVLSSAPNCQTVDREIIVEDSRARNLMRMSCVFCSFFSWEIPTAFVCLLSSVFFSVSFCRSVWSRGKSTKVPFVALFFLILWWSMLCRLAGDSIFYFRCAFLEVFLCDQGQFSSFKFHGLDLNWVADTPLLPVSFFFSFSLSCQASLHFKETNSEQKLSRLQVPKTQTQIFLPTTKDEESKILLGSWVNHNIPSF